MKKILTVLTIVGLAAASLTAVGSGMAETRRRQVEIAVDMADVQALARDSGKTVRETLAELRDLGATAVGLREGSVNSYQFAGRLTVATGGGLLNTWRQTGQLHPRLRSMAEQGRLLPEAVYLLTDEHELIFRLLEAAQVKMSSPARLLFNSPPYVLEVMADVNRVLALRAGLDRQDVQTAQEVGLRVVARPDNPFLKSDASVRRTLQPFLSLPREQLSAVVFDGPEATGFPDYLETVAAVLNEAQVPVGVVEIVGPQAGVSALAAKTGDRALLVHSNAPTATPRSMVNAVTERRVRLLYLRLPLQDPELPASGPALLAEVTAELERLGWRNGRAESLPHPRQSPALLFLSFLGVAAASGLLGVEIMRKEEIWLWAVPAAAFLTQLAAWLLLPDHLARQLSSVAAAIILPVLAIVSQQLNRLPVQPLSGRASAGWTIAAMLRTFLVIAAGGLAVFGLTATPLFSAGAVTFRGVKLVHTVPLLLIALVVVMRLHEQVRREWTVPDLVVFWRRILGRPLLVVYLFLFAGLSALVLFYVARTGHAAGVPVSELELNLRAMLGDLLLVRPRLKEFLFGYPLAVLGLTMLAGGRRDAATAALLTLGAIAPVSMTNTFMHFTASLPVILLRSFNGLWLGLLFGALLTAAVLLLVRATERRGIFS